jgi:hypothetical protein
MTETQRLLARHALGLPNARNHGYRYHFCASPGTWDFKEWQAMVIQGEAVCTVQEPTGYTMFYLKLDGAIAALNPKETIAYECLEEMRRL